MEGGKTNRERTQRCIIVQLSLTDCGGSGRLPVRSLAGSLSAVLKPASLGSSHACLTCSPCLCECAVQKWNISTLPDASCASEYWLPYTLATSSPLYLQLGFHGENSCLSCLKLSDLLRLRHKPGELDSSVHQIVFTHPCVPALSKKSNSKQRDEVMLSPWVAQTPHWEYNTQIPWVTERQVGCGVLWQSAQQSQPCHAVWITTEL